MTLAYVASIFTLTYIGSYGSGDTLKPDSRKRMSTPGFEGKLHAKPRTLYSSLKNIAYNVLASSLNFRLKRYMSKKF